METKVDYEAVFHAMFAPFAVLTPDMVVVAVNDAYLRAIGRTREEVIGRPIFTAFPANPEALDNPDAPGVEPLRASLERVLAGRTADVAPLVRRDVPRNGRPGEYEERYWNLVSVPVLGADGEVRYIVHRSEDVTPFVKWARGGEVDGTADMRHEDLQRAFYARAQDLVGVSDRLKHAYRQEQQTVSALQEAIEQQQRFLFDATHDLRTPITALLTELEVALTEPETDLRKTLVKLHRDVERLNAIVDDLLSLARMYAAQPPSRELFDLTELVEHELEAHPPSGNVITRFERPAPVRASRVRLARLLSNLVANAERHTTNKIEIVVTADPPDAVLEVIDDGPGIPPEDRERIFHRLYRRRDAESTDAGGSGFGLSIAREIAQGYGGHLYAADHPTGARFVLRLPLATDADTEDG
jgi:Signal transduction histidine kinase